MSCDCLLRAPFLYRHTLPFLFLVEFSYADEYVYPNIYMHLFMLLVLGGSGAATKDMSTHARTHIGRSHGTSQVQPAASQHGR